MIPLLGVFLNDVIGIVQPVDGQDASGGVTQGVGAITRFQCAVQKPDPRRVVEQSTVHGVETWNILLASDPTGAGAIRPDTEIRWYSHFGVAMSSQIPDGAGNLTVVPYIVFNPTDKAIPPDGLKSQRWTIPVQRVS